jgi:hypothetical protein
MHRLQISLPGSQVKYLTDRAKREGISIAELLRRLIHRELDQSTARGNDSLREIIGIGKTTEALIDNIPVSEQPDLYLYEPAAAYSKTVAVGKKKRGRRAR